MKKFYLFLIPFIIVIFAVPAYAACPSTPTAAAGISGAGSSSLAGLIVHTKNNGTSTNWSTTTTSNGSGMCDVTSSYGQGTCQAAMTYNTGSNYYIASQSTACSDTGYLWYGYGSSGAYGNGKALDCKNSSSTDYTFAIKVNVNQPTTLGHWDYSASGEKDVTSTANLGSDTDLTSNNNPTVTIKVYNGETAVVTFNWVPHANSAPTPYYDSPANNYTYSLSDTIYLNTKATDPNSDTVNHLVAYAKSTDGGASWGGWEYGSTGLVAQSSTTARTVTSFTASSKGAGYFKWVIGAHDSHGVYNAVPAGSPNYYSHNAPRYFTIADPAPTCTLTGGTTIYRGSSATLTYGTTNSTSASINQSVSALSPISGGTKSVSPTSTTTYTLSASGAGGNCSASTTVTVQYCGDGAQNGSEACDLGGSNGTCPATCSTSCTTNANSYALNYEDNTTETVTGMPGNTTFVTNVAKTLAPAPTRTGYTFNGWNRGSDGLGANYGASTSQTFTDCSAVTLHAKWTINTYTLTYNKNTLDSVSGLPGATNHNYNTDATVSSATVTNIGYTFGGWYLNTAGTGTRFGPGYTTTLRITDNTILHAKWTAYCILACPTATLKPGVTGGSCIYDAVLSDTPTTINLTATIPSGKGSAVWRTPVAGSLSSLTTNPTTYTASVYPGSTSVYVGSTDPNCREASVVINTTIQACSINNSDIVVNPSMLGINSVDTQVNPTFTSNVRNALSGLRARWTLNRVSPSPALIEQTSALTTLKDTWTRVINAIGNYNIKYEAVNGTSAFGSVIYTSQYGYCTANRIFDVVQTAYCKIKSTSGDAPLVLRVDADDNRAGASGEYIFTIKKADGSTYKTVNLPSAAGLVNLTQTIDLPGAYTVSVRRAVPASIDPETPCKTINASDTNNQINVTKPGTGSGGEVTPE